ncbi:MAG: hypothetical protein IPM54_45150 [Polyangiaceae bacterium]|nr:hypothetical protein [Polyangiaceae bacterium]
MSDPKHPKIGDVVIDASGIPLIDSTPERIRQLTKLRDGFEAVVTSILQLAAADVERAGLNPAEIQRLKILSDDEAYLGQLHAASQKLTELLYETRMERRHEIGTLLGEFAAQSRRRGDRAANKHEVLGPVATLLEYQYGPAKQAAATKEAAQGTGNDPGKEP